MADNVVRLVRPGGMGEGVAIEPDAVLSGALGNLTKAIVIGVDKGGELYVASSEGQADTFAHLDLAKAWMLGQIMLLRGWA